MVFGGFICNVKSLKLACKVVEHISWIIDLFKSLKIFLKLIKTGVLIFITKTVIIVYLEVGDMVSLVRAIIIIIVTIASAILFKFLLSYTPFYFIIFI